MDKRITAFGVYLVAVAGEITWRYRCEACGEKNRTPNLRSETAARFAYAVHLAYDCAEIARYRKEAADE